MATTTRGKRASAAPRYPEKKYGPFHGGVGVAVWLNEVQTDSGTRYFRSLTVNPRRFRSKKTGEWEDAGSLRTTDIPSLVLALEAALQFCNSTPLPGQAVEEEQMDDSSAPANGDTPF